MRRLGLTTVVVSFVVSVVASAAVVVAALPTLAPSAGGPVTESESRAVERPADPAVAPVIDEERLFRLLAQQDRRIDRLEAALQAQAAELLEARQALQHRADETGIVANGDEATPAVAAAEVASPDVAPADAEAPVTLALSAARLHHLEWARANDDAQKVERLLDAYLRSQHSSPVSRFVEAVSAEVGLTTEQEAELRTATTTYFGSRDADRQATFRAELERILTPHQVNLYDAAELTPHPRVRLELR